MNIFNTHSLEETGQIAKQWLVSISNKYSNKDEAMVVGLSGHLGAGKTAFVKEVAKQLGISEDVTSPTFVIMKIYEIKDQIKIVNENGNTIIPWNRLIHIDAYRLEKKEELDVLGWENIVAGKNNLILIEWPENVGLDNFDNEAHLSFEASEGNRTISF